MPGLRPQQSAWKPFVVSILSDDFLPENRDLSVPRFPSGLVTLARLCRRIEDFDVIDDLHDPLDLDYSSLSHLLVERAWHTTSQH